jgi:hypothetical protein
MPRKLAPTWACTHWRIHAFTQTQATGAHVTYAPYYLVQYHIRISCNTTLAPRTP